ncbi:MAG: hypothetical protein IJH84_23385 [Saccharopolyspora sp.]|uniref:hypothetical protein n=1 Tax=Saccharopolyspora TaxID=1835 RepID=UPI001909C37F|nr:MULTISPECIES: hypothetical protein [unclassified Saccharopolyspora]MBK0866397.1 hypothetical protein [Saccharopolyspora sp. HNM0986]MBQ6643956.1 hypothetical protein [Saccharopolyspora sp.]
MSSLTELMAALRATEAKLDEANRGLTAGRRSLAEAKVALAKLDPDHPETVVPAGMSHADDQLERTQAAVAHVVDTLRTYAAGL